MSSSRFMTAASMQARRKLTESFNPTSQAVDAPLMRLPIEPSEQNGLRASSHLMIDKITTVSRKKLDSRVGRLSDEDIVRVNRALIVFLGLAGPGVN